MKRSSDKGRPRPKAIDEIANLVTLAALFAFFAGCIFLVAVVADLKANPHQSFSYQQEITLTAAVFGLTIAVVLAVLAAGFRALKHWAYYGVEFVAQWSTLRPLLLGKVKQKDVRRAFGISAESETDTSE